MNTTEPTTSHDAAPAGDQTPGKSAPVSTSDKKPYQVPLSARGRRTRADLITAARKIFVRDGFPDSRIVDIAKRARSSIGSFYTYFESKEDILAAVLAEARSDMLHIAAFADGDELTEQPAQALEAMIFKYLKYYRDNAGLMLLIEQVASIDAKFRADKRERELVHIRTNTKVVATWRDRGLAHFDGDPLPVMTALSGMVNRYAYNNRALSPESDPQELTQTCLLICTRTLNIP